ncbi:MAG: hypothetical protein ACXAC7_21300 [Candidatus Hodarchaeales archaeon]|jgi:hypothetical protein
MALKKPKIIDENIKLIKEQVIGQNPFIPFKYTNLMINALGNTVLGMKQELDQIDLQLIQNYQEEITVIHEQINNLDTDIDELKSNFIKELNDLKTNLTTIFDDLKTNLAKELDDLKSKQKVYRTTQLYPVIYAGGAHEEGAEHEYQALASPKEGTYIISILPKGARIMDTWYEPYDNIGVLKDYSKIKVNKHSDTEIALICQVYKDIPTRLRLTIHVLFEINA